MKTIRETAETVGVSKTAVYNAVKKYSVPTFKKGGITYVTEKGFKQILVHFTTSPTKKIENDCAIGLEKQLVENQQTIQKLFGELEKSRRQKNILLTACIGFVFWLLMRR